jgi:hypothetical protein
MPAQARAGAPSRMRRCAAGNGKGEGWPSKKCAWPWMPTTAQKLPKSMRPNGGSRPAPA